MHRSVWVFVALASASLSAFAVDTYTVDPRHTFPSFAVDHMGFSVQRGRFNETSGKISLDSEAGTGSIQIAINAASISTGLAELEEHLRKDDFLDTARFAQITYSSERLQFVDGQLRGVDGRLTLHGVTKPVHLDVDHFHCGVNMISMKPVCGANAVAKFKRSEFGVGKYVPMVGDEVEVAIQIEAVKD